MTYVLRATQNGDIVLEAEVSELYGRMISLLGSTIPQELADKGRPEDAPVFFGRLLMTIEDALSGNIDQHTRWRQICDVPGAAPLEVDIFLTGKAGDAASTADAGGGGGQGAWPGGGGGAGGVGAEIGGIGGAGADGAIAIFLYRSDGTAFDVDVVVTPGEGTWLSPSHDGTATIICIGAGAGGGSAMSSLERSIVSRIEDAVRHARAHGAIGSVLVELELQDEAQRLAAQRLARRGLGSVRSTGMGWTFMVTDSAQVSAIG